MSLLTIYRSLLVSPISKNETSTDEQPQRGDKMIDFIEIPLPSGKKYAIRVEKDQNGNVIKETLCKLAGDLWVSDKEL